MDYELAEVVSIGDERNGTGTGIHRIFDIPADIDLNLVVFNGVKTIMCSMCEQLAEFKLVCVHQLCKKCLSALHVCPKHKGGAEIDRSQVQRLMYSSELVKCPNKDSGCKCEVRLDELKIHLGNCRYKLVPCSRCGMELLSSELEYHLSASCDWRTEECPFCSIIMNFRDLRNHLNHCHRTEHKICAGMRKFKCQMTMFLKECFRNNCPCCVSFFLQLLYHYLDF